MSARIREPIHTDPRWVAVLNPRARLPVFEHEGRFAHVTTREIAERIMREGAPRLPERSEGPCPHEGLVFSVSLHPEEWAWIAKLGDSVVVVDFDGPALDYRAFVKRRRLEEISEIVQYATRGGWATVGETWLIHVWDSEKDELRYFETSDPKEVASYGEQLAESEEMRRRGEGEEVESVFGEDVREIEHGAALIPTPKLIERMRRHYAHADKDCAVRELLNMWLRDTHPEIEMVYYDWVFDPAGLSAPVDSILPHHFKDVRPVAVTTFSRWSAYERREEEEEEEENPESRGRAVPRHLRTQAPGHPSLRLGLAEPLDRR